MLREINFNADGSKLPSDLVFEDVKFRIQVSE